VAEESLIADGLVEEEKGGRNGKKKLPIGRGNGFLMVVYGRNLIVNSRV
jgi:hypothetical protein